NSGGGNGGFKINGTYTPAGGGAPPIKKIPKRTGAPKTGEAERFFHFFSPQMGEGMVNSSEDNNSGEGISPSNLPLQIQQEGGTPQVADFEPESYSYRLNGACGVVVQPYWSPQDSGFVVPDGNAQTLTLHPNWTIDNSVSPAVASFSGYSLEISGDQRGSTDT